MIRKIGLFFVVLVVFTLSASGTASLQTTTPESEASSAPPRGIYWRTNENSDLSRYGGVPFLAGGRGAFFSWCEIEPAPGQFDFSKVEQYIVAWKNLNKKAIIGISAATSSEGKSCPVYADNPNITSASPGWLFTSEEIRGNIAYLNVPQKGEVETSELRNFWPVYWTPRFINRYNFMFTSLLDYLSSRDLLRHVAWFEVLHGKENSTNLARDDFYQDYVDFYISNGGVDKNGDGLVNEVDFEIFWAEFLRSSISKITPILNSRGTKGMLVVVDYQVPILNRFPKDHYFQYLKDVAAYAVSQGWYLGGKSLDIEPMKVAEKPAVNVFVLHPNVPKALWNDFTSFGQNHTVSDFVTNYHNAIGGSDTGVPVTNINYVMLAPNVEVEAVIARKVSGQNCAQSPNNPNQCWNNMPACTNDPQNTGLCWPELQQTIDWLKTKLKDTTDPTIVGLSSISLNPITVIGGKSSIGTITLYNPAPAGGVVVSLMSSNPSVATVPVSVTVPAGAPSATFIVKTSKIVANTTVTISATLTGVTKTALLTVNKS